MAMPPRSSAECHGKGNGAAIYALGTLGFTLGPEEMVDFGLHEGHRSLPAKGQEWQRLQRLAHFNSLLSQTCVHG